MKKIMFSLIFTVILVGQCLSVEVNTINDELCRNNSLTKTLISISERGDMVGPVQEENTKNLIDKVLGTFYKGPIQENEEKIIGYKYETLLIVTSPSKQKYLQKCVTNHDLTAQVTRITCFDKKELESEIFIDP